jgi:hypothetical protein
VASEQLDQRERLGEVVRNGRGAVGVHVVDVAPRHAGVGQSQLHAAEGTVALRARRDQVVRVGARAVTHGDPEDVAIAP